MISCSTIQFDVSDSLKMLGSLVFCLKTGIILFVCMYKVLTFEHPT